MSLFALLLALASPDEAFLRALTGGNPRALAEISACTLAPEDSWSARDAMERFDCIDVHSARVTTSADAITIELDATGTTVNALRQRVQLPAAWRLERDPATGEVVRIVNEDAAPRADAASDIDVESLAAMVELLDDPRPALLAIEKLGHQAFNAFEVAKSYRLYDELEERSRRMGWRRGEAAGLHNKARASAAAADYDSAKRFTLRAAEVAAACGDAERQSRALATYGQILTRKGFAEEAWPVLEQALRVAPLDSDVALAAAHVNLVSCHLARHDIAAADQHVEPGALYAGRAGTLPAMYALWSAVRMAQGRYAEAMELSREGIRANANSLWQVWALKFGLAQGYRDCGDTDRAIEELYSAIDLVEARRSLLTTTELARARYFTEHFWVYELLIETLVEANRHDEALAVAERMRARSLAERAGAPPRPLTPHETETMRALDERLVALNRALLAESGDDARLRRELRETRAAVERLETELVLRDPSDASRTAPVRLTDEAPPLPHDAAAIELVLLPKSILAFVVRDGAVRAIRIADVEAVRRHADALARVLAAREAGYAPHARALHDLLIAPLRQELRGVRQLQILPDEFLWNVPFEALLAPNGTWLGDAYSIEYRPSLRALERRDALQPTRELMALANPEIGAARRRDLQRRYRNARLGSLPDAAVEAREVSRLYDAARSEVRIGRDARESLFKANAARYRVIHLATHGLSAPGSPLYSSVVLAANGADGEDGLLEAREIRELSLNADVVVLAACDTAGSEILRGEGLLGLGWSFLAAGASTAVVSRWQADSRSTSQLMVELHRHLVRTPDASAADALRAARKKLRAQERYKHPFYWASFVAVGGE